MKEKLVMQRKEIDEKDTLHEELEEACKETILHYQKENKVLTKEKVMKKKILHSAE